MNETIKKYLLGSTVIAGMMVSAFAMPAYAQDSDEESEEEIVVTGSRIVRKDNYTAVGPVNVIGADDIEIAAKNSLGDLLEELPSVAFVGDGTSVNNGSGGLQTIDLRGLGTDRLLVLMNGRRVSPVGSGINNLVDLQIFPQAAIERVEILKDGAAAVYGADAISGVINVITTKDFEGIDLTARLGTADRGDGEQFNLGATIGTATEKASIMATVSYSETEGVYQSDREISNCPRVEPGVALWLGGIFGTGPGDIYEDPLNSCSGSSFTPNGRFFTSNGSRTIVDGQDQGFSFVGGDAYNFNPLNYLRTPNSALSAFVTADYEISDSTTAYMELLYNKRRSKQDLAPVPMGSGAQFTYGLTIPAANPYNIYGEDIAYRKRMLDVGPRLFDQESDTIRLVGGVTGTFAEGATVPFFGGATWDVSFTGDYNNGNDKNGNLIDMFRVENALNTEVTATSGAGTVTVGGVNYRCADATARQLGCVPLNLFGANSITQDAAEYIRLNTVDKFSSNGTVTQATLSNSLFDLPAGPVGVVVGAEYRTVEGSSDIDAAIANGYSSGNPAQSTTGKITAYDYFGEIEVPLLADKPGFQELTFNGAYRISDYDSFDAGNTYRASIAWSPIEDLRLRGGLATSYRTPSLSNLFNGGSGGFPTYSDPCASTNAEVIASTTATGICASQGVTPGVFTTGNAQVLSFITGARIVGTELEAERGKTKTLGLVYRPSNGFLSDVDFEAAIDYYDIEVENAIGTTGTQGTINGCYIDGDAGDCSQVSRAFGGDILRVNTSFTNLTGESNDTAEGIDWSFRASKELWKGDIGLDLRGTYLLGRVATDSNGNTSDSKGLCFGFTGACFNDHRINASVNYATDNFRLSWSTRFLSGIDTNYSGFLDGVDFGEGSDFDLSDGELSRDEVVDYFVQEYGVAEADIRNVSDAYFIDDYFYHDVNVRYSFDNDLQFTAGIDNLFDKDAPHYKYVEGFFDPTENSPVGTYSTLGRFLYVGFDKKF